MLEKELCCQRHNYGIFAKEVTHSVYWFTNGSLPGGHLMYKAGQTRGNKREETNSKNFEKWISGILIRVPAVSVIVMHNAPYNLIQEDKYGV
jgi:hypothetical protein